MGDLTDTRKQNNNVKIINERETIEKKFLKSNFDVNPGVHDAELMPS